MKKCVASLEIVVAIHVGIDVVTVILIFADVAVAATLILIFADVAVAATLIVIFADAAIAATLIVISIAEGFNCQWYGQIISGKYFKYSGSRCGSLSCVCKKDISSQQNQASHEYISQTCYLNTWVQESD